MLGNGDPDAKIRSQHLITHRLNYTSRLIRG